MTLDTLFPLGIAHYLAGGLVIGFGVSLLFATTGLIGGASTVFTSTWSLVSRQPYFSQVRFLGARRWRLVYAAGMVLGALAWALAYGSGSIVTGVPLLNLAIGGFLVGFGARLSHGCTSGHGICGLASLRLPSLLAVLTFLATGIATAHVVRSLAG
jgi:hypothetical protein